MLKKIFLLLAISFALTASFALAQDNKQEKFLTDLEAGAQQTNSISSDFIQKSYISMFEDTIESTGRFVFARPDNLRWEYSSPYVSGFLLRGGKGLRWDADSPKAQPFSTETSPEMGVISQQILAWTTMNITWLRSTYDLKIIKYDPAVMILTPKSKAARDFLSKIKIYFSADAKHLTGIELHEPGGDYTEIKFPNVKINEKLAKDVFEKR